MQRVLRGLSLIVVCFGASCAGDLEHPENFSFLRSDAGASGDAGAMNAAPPPACVTELFDASCGSSACHGKGTTVLDLESPGVANRLVNHATNPDSVCKDRTLVATDGTQSLLLQKLTSAMPPCGSQMPFGGGMASDDEIACVRDWITSLNGGTTQDDAGAP
jgi:hypothetical protein